MDADNEPVEAVSEPGQPDTLPTISQEPVEVEIPTKEKRSRSLSRITVVDYTYHRLAGENPVGVDVRFSRQLKHDEQLYKRKFKLGTSWRVLDTGWYEGLVGMFVLINRESPVSGQSVADLVEKQDLPVIEVGLMVEPAEERGRTQHSPRRKTASIEPLFFIMPGESLRASPFSPSRIYIRSRVEDTSTELHVMGV